MSAREPTQITGNSYSAFNWFSKYARNPGRNAHNYAELAVSSPAVAKTIISTHCTYPQRDGLENTGMVFQY